MVNSTTPASRLSPEGPACGCRSRAGHTARLPVENQWRFRPRIDSRNSPDCEQRLEVERRPAKAQREKYISLKRYSIVTTSKHPAVRIRVYPEAWPLERIHRRKSCWLLRCLPRAAPGVLAIFAHRRWVRPSPSEHEARRRTTPARPDCREVRSWIPKICAVSMVS